MRAPGPVGLAKTGRRLVLLAGFAGLMLTGSATLAVVEEDLDMAHDEERQLNFKKPVQKFELDDPNVASVAKVAPRALVVVGKRSGGTMLSVWFDRDEAEPAYRARLMVRGQGPVILDVRVNGSEQGSATLFRLRDGRLLVTAEQLAAWRLNVPSGSPSVRGGRRYHSLDAVPGMRYRVDEASQTVHIEGQPQAFAPVQLDIPGRRAAIAALPQAGGFLNYDLMAQRIDNMNLFGGQLEFGLFNRLGAGTSSFIVRQDRAGSHAVRLDTRWLFDRQDDMTTLAIGDSISRAGAWGRPVRFAGIQWGTDFSLQPGFIAYPMPTLRGEAVLPSTVDVYVDNILSLRRDAPYGPFEIPAMPVFTGQGDVRMVVRDLLGREQIVTQSYYATPLLLREGLRDFSLEAGFIRANYGLAGNDYGRFMAVATDRLGVSDRLTRELRGELTVRAQAVGAAYSWLMPDLGTAQASLAASHGPAGDGVRASVSLARQTRGFGFSVEANRTDDRYVDAGYAAGEAQPRETLSARMGWSPRGRDAVSVAWLQRSYWQEHPEVRVLNLGYNISLDKGLHLSLYAVANLAGERQRSIGFMLSLPLGDGRSSATLSVNRQRDRDEAYLQMQKNLPSGEGIGYRLIAGHGDHARQQADLSWQTAVGTYNANVAAWNGGGTDYRLGASGGMALLGGGFAFSRRLGDAFALVRTADHSGVRVYADHQPVAVTNERGLAIVPRLRPYESNEVAINLADLPIGATVGATSIQVVPYRRSGVVADFPLRSGRSALLTVLLPGGEALPVGARVRIDEEAHTFPVAMRGQVFVTGLGARNRLSASWNRQGCGFQVDIPRNAGPIPRLGPFYCSPHREEPKHD